jgi:hypothetical protein
MDKKYIVCSTCIYKLWQNWCRENDKPVHMVIRKCHNKPECFMSYFQPERLSEKASKDDAIV